ncbi:signal transducer and activator of transcription 1-alpha/beta-like [Synchiropus splendidus]|uniref:signal transducer and activator of transcription 1-alpha/beta-like n=1 Tax=Synchiropus splendidus TaxID=270530 RepID=UPI00237D85F5|nr:signal transducer and activator of transcription 1-alpha/beta-like [Synchiropus splendidus]XP_053732434.1 signal transducer and activator of transcription 1-alpha/beta-like [Synchiropus splendidus]XP_053732435.1 signal transducer and activator of transcription 1-alpha/beta-like [Synchiropus splendidus]
MGRWEDLLKLDPDQQVRVNELYSERFPREIRRCLSQWIESQDWDSAAEDADKANTCFQNLLVCLDQQLNYSVSRKSVLEEPNYEWFKYYLQKHFGDQPQKLAALLSECLREEDKILGSMGTEHPAQQCHLLDKHVEDLKKQILEMKKELKSLQDLQENLIYAQSNWQPQVDSPNGMKETLVKLADIMTQTEERVLQHMVGILQQSEQVAMTLITVELPQWKQRQHMACVGRPIDTRLDHLQKWFTGVVEVLMELQRVLDKLQAQKQDDTQASNLSRTTAEIQGFNVSLLTKILSHALVVEKQPSMSTLPLRPLILRTGVRFSMGVRFLANLPEFKCALNVQPVFDKDIEEAMKGKGFRHFDFTMDGRKVLDMDALDGGLVAVFNSMTIEDTKSDKGTSKCSGAARRTRLGVTEELHLIKFVCDFQHGLLKLNFETSSLPLVVVKNTIQCPSAWAAIMWCSLLPPADLENLSVFAEPPQVPWTQLSEVLSWQFSKVGKRGLDPDQLSMLHVRITGGNAEMVKWGQFKLAWTWLDGILDLIKKHLVDLWSEGLIMGFVTKEKTFSLLTEKPSGTFLLRFSESIIEGAISVSYVDHPNTGVSGEVIHVDPFLKSELETQSLPNVIYDYTVAVPLNHSKHPLVYLYPDIPKDAVFKRFYKDSGDTITDSGYVRRRNVPESRRSPPLPQLQPDDWAMETDLDFKEIWPEVGSFLTQMPFSENLPPITAQDLNSFTAV